MLGDREPAEDRVAELVAAQQARRRHDPSHAERGADLFGVAAAARAGADDFLQRHDVGVDGPEHRGDAVGTRAPVEAAAPMDVVGGNPQRRGGVSHYAMISREAGDIIMAARLKSEIEVTCPCCQAALVIDTNLGRVVAHKEPERGNKPELSDAQRILAERSGAARGGLPAVGRLGEVARRRVVEAVRRGAAPGARRADHQAVTGLRSGLT